MENPCLWISMNPRVEAASCRRSVLKKPILPAMANRVKAFNRKNRKIPCGMTYLSS